MTLQRLSIMGMPYFPGRVSGSLQYGMAKAKENSIVILMQHEIATVSFIPAGFVVVEGAPVSHAMIKLFGFGVPTIIISEQQARKLEQGVAVVLNGTTGLLSDKLDGQEKLSVDVPVIQQGQPIITADGVAVHLRASVRNAAAAKQAIFVGAEAIGLVRSEFLMPPDGQVPDVAFYQEAFAAVCEAASPLSVTIRLLDVAADKVPDWMPVTETTGDSLGMQGVRLYSTEPVRSVYQAQLAAISALAERYNINLLVPYLVRYEELQYWLGQIKSQLPSSMKVGAMAETPASVLDISNWLELCDFVAIGCNDLMQCLFAADRDRTDLRYYLDPYAPLLFRFMQQIAVTAGDKLDKVQLCGVLSQLQGVLPVLIGLGYRIFSVDAPFIPYLAKTVAATSIIEAQTYAAEVCKAHETQQVLEILGLHPNIHRPFLA